MENVFGIKKLLLLQLKRILASNKLLFY